MTQTLLPRTTPSFDAYGDIEPAERAYARAKLGNVVDHLWAVRSASLELRYAASSARPAIAKARLEVGGQIVRAHVAAATMRAAIDLLEATLRQRLEIVHELAPSRADEIHMTRPRRPANVIEYYRPEFVARPVDERAIARRKTYSSKPMAGPDAAREAELRDYDFFLFSDAATGCDAVVRRMADGTWETIGSGRRPFTRSVATDRIAQFTVGQAVELLAVSNARFVFFIEPASGRLHALYRRYDGNYGLISPE